MKYRDKQMIRGIIFLLVLVIIPEGVRNSLIEGTIKIYTSIVTFRVERRVERMEDKIKNIQESLPKSQSGITKQ